MERPATSNPKAATLIRNRIETGGDRLWRLHDFRDLSAPAAAQALSRMARQGKLRRLSKGLYYRPRQTALGTSHPNPIALRKLATDSKPSFPAGTAAANHLGFTTQNPGRAELATTALSLPRKLIGERTIIHTRRPEAWSRLDDTEAAILDFLRNRGRTSELSAHATMERMKSLLSEPSRYKHLLAVADTEPPRVRAMLGAFGELLPRPGKELDRLRDSLNPLSRFDFGIFTALPNARDWQAKSKR